MATKQTTNASEATGLERQLELMVGRIVHYVDNAQQCRAAIVTQVPLDDDGKPFPDGLCSLMWFDYQAHAAGNVRHPALVAGEEPTSHTYHWFGNQAGASH